MQKTLIIIVAILLPMLATAQEWIEHTVDGEFDYARSVYAADVDSDGDMDVLGAAASDSIVWWENLDGTGLNWSKHTVDGEFDGAQSVYAADVDGDGDLDVLGAAELVNHVTWWENLDGTGLNWSEHTVASEFEGAGCVYAADVDGDGDMDVLGTAEIADDITWWENLDGTGQNWSEHTLNGEFNDVESVYAADVDGDGDMDVLGAAEYADDITWWENLDGAGQNWSEHAVDGEFDGAHSVYAADVDGDGDMDVVGAGEIGNIISWWENLDGTGLNWSEHIVDGEFEHAYCVYAADVDGDGDIDVLGAARDANDIAWWENLDGLGLTWLEHTLTSNFSGAHCVYASDLDGDGDLDVLGAAKWSDNIYWWENPTVGVEEKDDSDLPDEYALSSVYPNPFNPTTSISVNLPDAAELTVVVYNLNGQQVSELANGQFTAGSNTFTFNGFGMASGLYFVRATVPGHLDEVRKIVLMK